MWARGPSWGDRGRSVATMEATPTTETTKQVVIERDVPEPAIAGLVEFVNRYYFPPKMKFIEALSYRKTENGDGFELFWRLKPVGPEQARPTSSAQDLQSCHRARFSRVGPERYLSGERCPEHC